MSAVPSEPRYPTADEEASLTAMTAAIDEVVAAFQKDEVDRVASAGERLLAVPVDMEAFVNVLRVPDDAGDLAPAFEAILWRIPDGWGRWIRIERGWYPIVVRLDQHLAELDPNYVVLQVKEKFGGLRYYWRPSDTGLQNATTKVGNKLVQAAVALAARTCDACGRPGGLMERRGWLRTLCNECAETRKYADAGV